MSIEYCEDCNRNVDTDTDLHEEHFKDEIN